MYLRAQNYILEEKSCITLDAIYDNHYVLTIEIKFGALHCSIKNRNFPFFKFFSTPTNHWVGDQVWLILQHDLDQHCSKGEGAFPHPMSDQPSVFDHNCRLEQWFSQFLSFKDRTTNISSKFVLHYRWINIIWQKKNNSNLEEAHCSAVYKTPLTLINFSFCSMWLHSANMVKLIKKKINKNLILLFSIQQVKLPDAEFFINLGDWPLEKRAASDSPLPILSWCGSDETRDIVMPTYDVTESTMETMGRWGLDPNLSWISFLEGMTKVVSQ